ncbi:MAG: GIY-YIG nuclease family protein [Parcubacteria group bacterium]|nr:GIY-YIG nuclease family protein [Parcubacteria group bacterium]
MLSLPKKIPQKPGVYFFLDKKRKVLYVGRAVNLKRRLRNYFENNLEPRIQEMVSLAKQIKYQETTNLLEAVILEANLIKKYWPKYNVREKDNRSFVYVVIPKTDFTKPIIIRGRELSKFPAQKAHIFGPYKSLTVIEAALKIIRRLFPYSTCKVGSGKPCFDHQIGLCPGACIGAISKEDYQKNIDNIILLLQGRHQTLLRKLTKENPEKADALKHLRDVALISREDYYLYPKFNRLEGYDISHFAGKETYGSMVVFEDGKPLTTAYRLFKIKEAPANDDLRALSEVILRRLKHLEWHLPDLMVIDGGKPQIDYLTKVFKKYNIKIPLVGISKYQNDKLVFVKNTKPSFKDLAQNIKPTLLKVREEAHRFAIMAGRRKRIKNMLK